MSVIAAESVAEILGLGKSVRSVQDLESAVSSGLPKRSLERLSGRLWADTRVARTGIHKVVPLATWKRRKTKLSVSESERTERLARLLALAEYVLDDKQFAREWMTQPHLELDGRAPVDAAQTELGARRVEDILMRILFGLPV
ncbi:MAG: DUF2384 domain-containing protein [Acidobacteria bacterium]|nr:DUF2384 domain-containing protein [Acidobacteriota bacterium]